jgi:hypothetical protein
MVEVGKTYRDPSGERRHVLAVTDNEVTYVIPRSFRKLTCALIELDGWDIDEEDSE